jgi:hypothetical protein
MGANIYLRTDLHEKIILKKLNPSVYVNKVVEEALNKEDVEAKKG